MQTDAMTQLAKDARILIVDDEATNIDALGTMLSRAGYGICISITDPRTVAARFQELDPDLLLLDWHMDERSGLQVLRDIREQVPAESMPPVLVLTADDSPATKLEALAAGVSDFLSKPLDFAEVLLRIRNLLMLRVFHLREENEKRSLEDQVRKKTAGLERALAELKESQHLVIAQERLRALGAMASGIAHDFNNMLTVIMGYSDLFQDRLEILRKPDAALDAFEVIGKAASDASEIVDRLRKFYRPYESGEDDHKVVNICDIAREAVELSTPRWKTQAEAEGIFVDMKMELRDVPEIIGSAVELREVVMNLVFNAVDAMPMGGKITVRTGVDEEEGQVFFEVEDGGIGMTEETRRHCLEPFFTTKGKRGTGLGLATTYGIVRRHGGIIRLNSQLHAGTCFTILLPIGRLSRDIGPDDADDISQRDTHIAVLAGKSDKKHPARHPVEAVTVKGGGRLSPLKVLVVDDQPDICHVLKHYLENDRHTVETAENGCDALEKFRGQGFDVVITDRVMPKMNGDQLAGAIKKLEPREKVILLTAFAQEDEKLSPDIDLLVRKPASLQMIRQAMREVVAA